MNPISQKTMEELYVDTKKKVKFLKDQGYRVVEKWGCELQKELEDNEEMKQFFDQNKIIDPVTTTRCILRRTYQRERNYYTKCQDR